MVARKRGAIVNIASSSGWYPMGLLTLYSATKAYVDFFSQGLALEYACKGIVATMRLRVYGLIC